MVYNPALNQFLLVEGKKKDISYSYPTLFNKKKNKHSSVASDTGQVPEAQVPPQHR